MTMLDTSPRRLILGLSAVLVVLAVFVSPGFFNIDEVIYFLGIDAVARTGGFVVDNGFDMFPSDDLRIWLLQPGIGGIVSQYPAGSAWAGALLVPVFGDRALIALNVAAGIGTLFATHALARSLFGSAKVGGLAVVLMALFSFWPEYVLGHWPHSVSVFCTTLALVLFVKAMARGTGALVPAVLSGLAIGAGMLFRLDGILLAPAIAVITVLWAARPVVVLAGGAVGLAPMLLVLAATNHAKFGTWNPLSYGGAGGATDLSAHAGSAGILLAAFAGLFVLRLLPPAGPRTRRLLALAVPVAVAALLLTPLAPYVWKLLRGSWAILFDATAINDPRPGVVRRADGTLWFWGLPKKALFQSLPWLGMLGFLVGARDVPWRAVKIVLTVSALWALPFLVLSWHGGLGSNMRYLLPILPGLAALTAWTLLRLAERAGDGPALVRWGLVGALAIAVVLGLVAPGMVGQIHQVYSTWLFLAVFAVSLAAGLVAWPGLTRAALLAAGASLGFALYVSVGDVLAAQHSRSNSRAFSRAAAEIPGPVIFYGPPEMFADAIGDPERLLALSFPPGGDGSIDPELVADACAAGYRIVMRAGSARGAGLPASRFTPVAPTAPNSPGGLVEVTCE